MFYFQLIHPLAHPGKNKLARRNNTVKRKRIVLSSRLSVWILDLTSIDPEVHLALPQAFPPRSGMNFFWGGADFSDLAILKLTPTSSELGWAQLKVISTYNIKRLSYL